VEVLAALAIMGVSMLGLTAGVLIAFGANGRSSRRTQMLEFAQSRLDRLEASTKYNICTGASLPVNGIDCTKMGAVAAGSFDPTVAPNTGGWILDILDRPNALTSTQGIDQMAGPVLVMGDIGGAVNEAATVTARATIATDPAGCASTAVATNMLCRELHIEFDPTSTYYHIWVRVSRGQNYKDGPVVLEGMVAK
jgi:hypothetical protein